MAASQDVKSAVRVIHVDAKSHAPLPHQTQAGTGNNHNTTIGINGEADLVDQTMTAWNLDSTVGGNANANTIVNEVLLDTIYRSQGERVLVLIFDCCANNRNRVIAMGLAQLLHDLGFYDLVIVIFLQRYHSKQLADRM